MYLLLLETSGNQNYIFASNKLRENIGASELIYRAGTQWVLESVGEITKNERLRVCKDSDLMRSLLTNKEFNPPIEDSHSIEVIIAASGKSLLLTEEKEDAKKIIRLVTQKALKEAPGIDICGVYVPIEWDKPDSKSLASAIKEIYKNFEVVHSRIPSPNLRFLRLPVVAECSTSGLPASQLVKNPDNEKEPVSALSFAKREASKDSLERMRSILRKDQNQRNFADNINALEKTFKEELKWLAVVHADGNGLGQIFLGFDKYVKDNRDYVNKLRRFSLALDLCTQEAFKAAIDVFQSTKKNILPVVPLVLGGDDLTVMCDGEYALEFTRCFLEAFERETSKQEHLEGIIPEIAKQAINSERLSACAGIAIIKPHFPFSVGYELAESLLKSAKETKKKVTYQQTEKPLACSALDFHIVYDSSGVELKPIRERLELKQDKIKLYKRPFVITDLNNIQEAGDIKWAEFHQWEKFAEKVRFFSKKNKDGKPVLPPSQANNLRSACFLGKEKANAEYQLIKQRYKDISQLEESVNSLFAQNTEENNVTGFLDALDAVGFLKTNKGKEK